MVSRWLVTTALEDSWPKNEPVLFLGEWCRRESQRDRWTELDSLVASSPWDDIQRRHRDQRYLDQLSISIMADTAASLNNLHQVDYGIRYWNILVGEWILIFTNLLFERWQAITLAIQKYDLSGTLLFAGLELEPSIDSKHFSSRVKCDDWNHSIYASIIRSVGDLNVETVAWSRDEGSTDTDNTVETQQEQHWKFRLLRFYSQFAQKWSREHDVFLTSTYLPLREELKLQLRLGQVPTNWTIPHPPEIPAKSHLRKWELVGHPTNSFEQHLRKLIPEHMPTVFVEGYAQLCNQIEQLPWPKSPRLIWTSNAHIYEDVFKAWAARKTVEGSKLFIGQHGGHYGVARWKPAERLHVEISDAFLTWGWRTDDEQRVRPVGQLKMTKPLGIEHAIQPHAVMVTNSYCTPPTRPEVGAMDGVKFGYLEWQRQFVALLPNRIRDALIVRLHAGQCRFDDQLKWHRYFPDIVVDDGARNLDELLRESRLYIATYNSTGFLQAFTMNIPTVIFWNPLHWELRDSALPWFSNLAKQGIFHTEPVSAANHIASVWDDIDGWWSSEAVRTCIEEFVAQYSRQSRDLLHDIRHCIGTSIGDKS